MSERKYKSMLLHVSPKMHADLVGCKDGWRLRSLEDTVKVLVNLGLNTVESFGTDDLRPEVEIERKTSVFELPEAQK